MASKLIKRKICLLGDGGVGKTSLIRRFVLDKFDDDYLVTIECKVTKKDMDIFNPVEQEDVKLSLGVWDIMGHKGLTKLHSTYFQGAKGALVVCDVTRDKTLANAGGWINSLREAAGDVPVVLLANKSDLIGKEELGIPLADFGEDAMKYEAEKFGCPYLMTSAKTGENVERAFEALGDLLTWKKMDEPAKSGKLSPSEKRAKLDKALADGKISRAVYDKNIAKLEDK